MSNSTSPSRNPIGNYSPARKGKISKVVNLINGHLRFESGSHSFVWVNSENIHFIQSADHYVKAFVQEGLNKKWMVRHSTLKEILKILPKEDFIRLNRFYLLNKKYFSHFDFQKSLLFLVDGTSIRLSHRISSFIIDSMKV
jgi:DNA-binding LytR/AlgR family response regulator